MKHKILQRIFALFSVFVLIFNSTSPLFMVAYAIDESTTPTPTVSQDAIPFVSPEPTAEAETPTQTETPVVTPTPEVTSAPTATPSDTPTETIIPTPDQVTATPTPEDALIIDATPTPANDSSPPSDDSSTNNSTPTPIQLEPTETPAFSTTPTATPVTASDTKDDQISAIILENVSAPSIDLGVVAESGSATLITDKPDYAPTDTALITGSNLNLNATYSLTISSSDNPATSTTIDVTTDDKGIFAYAYQLDGNYRPNYKVELKDSTGIVVATTTFTDSFSVDIDQCRNGAPGSPVICTGAAWVNGNAGKTNSHYREGDSVPYRIKFGDASTSGSNIVTIEWETTKGGKHAIDYLTTYNTTETAADPCSGISGCGSPTTYAIPDDPNSTVSQIPGVFTLFNGTITALSAYTLSGSYGGDSSTSITITFTATSSTPVLAWAGHIGSQIDWGIGNSAVNISGSPYHMRVGGQDRSLSADAILPSPGLTTQISSANIFIGSSVTDAATYTEVGSGPNSNGIVSGTTQFYVCGPGSVTPCTSTSNPVGSPVINSSNSATSPSFTPGSIGIYCFAAYYTPDSTAQYSPISSTVTTNECVTVANPPTGTIELKKVWSGTAGQTTLNIGTTAGDDDVDTQLTGAAGAAPLTTGSNTVNAGTYYVSETGGLSDYTSLLDCTNNGNPVTPGANDSLIIASNDVVICTLTNTRNAGSVNAHKLVDADGNGTYEVNTDAGANALGFNWNLDTVGTNAFGTAVSGVNTGSHNVNENFVSGYHFVGWFLTSDTSKTCANTTNTTLPASISVTTGNTTEITLCNARDTGTVIVHKDVQGPQGEDVTDTSNNFTVQLDAAGSQQLTDNGTVTYNNVSTGSHTVTESVIASGYTLYGISEAQGSEGNTAGLSVSVTTGQTTHVYVTNRQNSGSITVVKVVKDASGQTTTDHHTFTVQLNGADDDNTLADNNNVVYGNVNPGGPYTVSELDDTNYDNLGCRLVTGAPATGFNVLPGGEVTVTCTNQQKPGEISGYKFKADGVTGILGWTVDLYSCLSSGTDCNTLVDTAITDVTGFYSFTDLVVGFYKVVEDIVAGFTPVSVTSHNVTINPNTQSEDNNFSNFENINITVCKEDTNQNRIAGWDMTLNVDSVASGSAQQTEEDGCYTFTDLGPDHSYSVTEEDRAGWTPVSDPNFTFDFGIPQDGVNQNHTFINVELGTIIVKKEMVGDTGSFDFTENVIGTISVNNGTLTTNDVLPGTYTSIEGVETGWNLDSIACNDTTNGGTASTGNVDTRTATFNVDAGETVTCTFTNTKIPLLTVIKHVVTDNGGNAVAGDFTMNVTGTNVSDSSFPGDESGITVTLDAGAYSVTESGVPSGYTESDSTDCSGTIAAGEHKTCTITNDDQQAYIIVDKTVINDNGGNAAPDQFNLTVDAGVALDGVAVPVNPGIHTAGETLSPGYTAGAWGEDCNVNASVTVALGQTKTCTITNNDIAPKLHLRKVVVNNNGGTATVANFTLTADGTGANDLSGTSPVDSDGGLLADTFALSETPLVGYTASDWVCVGGKQTDSNVKIDVGGEATCTITNDDIAPSLTLVKVVDNNNGGTAVASSWTLTATGPTGFSGEGPSVSNGASFDAGTYDLSESAALPGYTNGTTWVCVGGTQDDADTITLGLGQSATCTIHNVDQAGHLIVHKITDPVSDTTTQFSIAASGSGNIESPATRSIAGGSSVDYTVDAGTYSVSEADLAGWDETGNDCTGIAIANGETKECTVTNTKRAHIIIQKNAMPDSNTQAFTFNNNFGNSNPATFDLTDTTAVGLPSYDAEVLPGKYGVSEDSVTGWQLDGTSCDQDETVGDIDVTAGKTVTCTFTNEKLAKIILVKNTIGGNGTFDFDATGTGLQADIDLTTVAGTESQTFENLDPDNTYSIAENAPAGWTETGASCDNNDPVTAITPNAGEVITCTFTNNKPAAQIDLDPLRATNKIGGDHEITANVQVHNGDGTWGPADDGTLVTFSITNSNGATASFVGGNTCTTISGSCSVTINSPTAGDVSIDASSSPVILGITVNVATGTGGENSADAQKDYVNARISITPPTSTNEVNDDHNFIVKVEQSVKNGVWTDVENAAVNAIVNPSTSLDVSDCNSGTDANGECTVIVNSSSAGVFTIIARSTITVNGVQFKLQTNGQGENSSAAEKTYVDGSIELTPQEATNNINDAHTITAHITKNDGSGITNAESVTVTFTVTSGNATFVSGDNDCITNVSGECTVQIIDSAPGTNTIDATTTFSVGGVSLTRTTNGNSGPDGTNSAEKTYVAGRIIVEKVTVGGDDSFEFDTDYGSNFTLSNGGSNDSGLLAPGTYSVSETLPSGWDQTSAVCDDQSPIDEISLEADEIVICTFTNTRDTGTLQVLKNVDLNGDGDYEDEGEVGAVDWFWQANPGSEHNTGDSAITVDTGDYQLSESPKDNFHFVSLSCDGGFLDTSTNTVTVTKDANVVCTFTNTRDTGSLKVDKQVDANGDGIFEGANTEGNTLGFRWGIDSETPEHLMGGTANPLPTGDYSVTELYVTGYHFTGWYYTNGDGGSCEEPEDTSFPEGITVNEGTTEITLCNARDTGTITVTKEVVSSTEDSGKFNLQIDEGTEKTDAQDGDSTGEVTVIIGLHSVGEIAGTETDLSDYITSISCNDESESSADGTILSDIQVNVDDNITCTITNTKKGKIIVTKYNDANGNGVRNEGESVLEGWVMHLSQGEPFSANQTTNALGIATFNNLPAGLYTLSEPEQAGWTLTNITCSNEQREGNDTSNEHSVTVPSGETVNCSVLNHSLTPNLTISKSNDAVGNRNPGDNVAYTIVVTVNDADANNLTVTDLLPKGFVYNSGSWTVDRNGSPLAISEPTYASPGTWSLGNAHINDVFTLKYTAKIDNGEQPGTYKDVAWAQGFSLADLSNKILATALPLGFVGTNFVGTQVTIGVGNPNGPTFNTTKTQEVLGAATYLPATGENTVWVIIASAMFVLGIGTLITGYKLKKRYVE